MAAISDSQESNTTVADEKQTTRRNFWHEHWPLILALGFLLAVLGVAFGACLWNTEGRFVYPLDDTYIHLALAWNFAEYGVWGVQPDVFASAASSLAWPLQLAGLLKILGRQEWLPLVLNLAWCLVGLTAAYALFRSAGMPRGLMFTVLLLLSLCPSLPVLVLMGMEHSMQAASALLFAWMVGVVVAAERVSWLQWLGLFLLAALAAMARFEGMFLIAAGALAALLYWRWREMLVIVLGGALPITVFGLYSLAHGGFFLPNSVVVKSQVSYIGTFTDFLQYLADDRLGRFLATTAVYLPLVLALLGVVGDAAGANRLRPAHRLYVLVVVLTAGMHLFAASTGTLARYEAYLVFTGIAAAALAWNPLLQQANLRLGQGGRGRAAAVLASCLLLGLCLLAPYYYRQGEGLFVIATASKNIHDQQVYMARFVKTYYDRQPIVINDLGTIAWYTEAKPVDMAGLATTEVTRAAISGKGTRKFLDQLARQKGARIAIVYTSWMVGGRAPEGWVKVGSWRIKDNVICGDEVVDFYALDEEAAGILAVNLREFQESLPADVSQFGKFITQK